MLNMGVTHIMRTMTDYRIPSEYAPLFFWQKDRRHPPYRYYDFSGGRSSGKSTTVALSLVLEAAAYPTRVLCAREFQNSIKDSVKKLLTDLIDDLHLTGYRVTNETIEHANGSTFIFKGLHNDPEGTIKSAEGIDRCWIEEAQTITAHSLDILLPTIRKNGSTIIFTRNPLTPDDVITTRFVTQPTDLTAQRTYHQHVTWRAMDRAGILPEEIRLQITEAEGTPEYAHVWEGQPYTTTINQIISWQQLADRTTIEGNSREGATILGVDVARYGTDRTVCAINTSNRLDKLDSWTHASITDTADRITTIASQYHVTAIHVDDTGVGGGLTDILAARGLPVTGINYAGRAKRPDLYPNIASELWFDFAERLPSITINPELSYRSELFTELTQREWKINTRNQRQVQAKADYKSTNDTRSPDLADAVLLAFYQPLIMPSWNVNI